MATRFIRVRDSSTGHEFDVPENAALLASGAAVHVKPKLYPPSRYPRPTKYRTETASRPRPAEDAATDGVAEATDTTEE